MILPLQFKSKSSSKEPENRQNFSYARGLVKELMLLLPQFGSNLAGDGKPIPSFGNPSKKRTGDRRREEEADWGVKKYTGLNQEGKAWEKIKSWFGFRLHLLVEADAELPVAYKITQASRGEQPVMRDLIEDVNQRIPELLERCDHALFDKGYDSTKNICFLWDWYRVKPIIDIKNMWKDGEKTKQLNRKNIQNVTYDYKGTVFCHCPQTGEIRRMAYNGFEERRGTLKYLCPVLAYGIECKGKQTCPLYRKALRIPLQEDRRIFTPVPRSSYKWQTLYDKRSSIERVNSRIDVSFGFERHYIRGLLKMNLRCGMALSVMLAIAVGRLRQKHSDLMRSLIKVA